MKYITTCGIRNFYNGKDYNIMVIHGESHEKITSLFLMTNDEIKKWFNGDEFLSFKPTLFDDEGDAFYIPGYPEPFSDDVEIIRVIKNEL